MTANFIITNKKNIVIFTKIQIKRQENKKTGNIVYYFQLYNIFFNISNKNQLPNISFTTSVALYP